MINEIEFLDIFFKIVIAWLAFTFSENFLQNNFERRKKILFVWIIIFAATNIFFSNISDSWSPHLKFLNIFPQIFIFYILQKNFFVGKKFNQIFIIASFIAGWEILRFTASPLAHAIFSLWNIFFADFINFLVENNFDSQKIIFYMDAVNRFAVFIVIFLCRAVQIAIFIFYLRTIQKNFSREFELNFQSGIFLIFPCVTVLLTDFTIRLITFSADNGAIFLIYERMPQIIFFLPIISILLLGIIISSVILFKNFVQFKAEEQKNLFLENRVVEVHREITELEEIYLEIRGLKHDLRNHLENILIYARGNSELEKYLQKMNLTIEKINFADRTGNAITDIIFHKIRQSTRKKNIKFLSNFYYKNDGRFDIYDLSVILNNSLQNAVEACEKVRGEKFIEIKSYERGGLFFIEIENNFDGEINKNFETTKSEKNLHGFGLENIRRCAKKYLGEVEIKIDKKIFRLTVMLYRRAE